MADSPETDKDVQDRPGAAQPVADLAAEAERGRTSRTPFLALAGVWVVVAVVVAVILALVLTLYFVYGGH
jgi:fatty acid desaturase